MNLLTIPTGTTLRDFGAQHGYTAECLRQRLVRNPALRLFLVKVANLWIVPAERAGEFAAALTKTAA